MRIIGVIPARYASVRFPGKVLADICGKPMIQRVFEQASKSRILDKILVATDSKEVFIRVNDFGGQAVMTSVKCQSGTDRIAEAVKQIKCDLVVNIQGDEPLISPEVIDLAIRPLVKDKNIPMGTAVSRITDKKQLFDHNVAKVVLDKNNFALYFTRAVIPASKVKVMDLKKQVYYKHIGLYVYRKEFLLKFASMPPTGLEKIESLEQLRALENGYCIKAVVTDYNSLSVDIPEDLEKIKRILRKNKTV
jgi:3-deoxy-manno-octulosonate cytidylyltransferase (CMP-KDO synthetase)